MQNPSSHSDPAQSMRLKVVSIDNEGFAKVAPISKEQSLPSCMKGVRLAPLLEEEEIEARFVRKTHPRNAPGMGKKKLFLDSWEITQSCSKRIEVRCPHFGHCGGCRLQHLSYSNQAQRKEEMVQSLFQPFGVELEPIVEAKNQWHYREKLQLTFSQDRHGTQRIGLYGLTAKRKVIDLERCDLFDPSLALLLEHMRTWWAQWPLEAYNASHHRGELRTITLRRGDGKSSTWILMLTLSNPITEDGSAPAIEAWQRQMEKFSQQSKIAVGLYTQIHYAKKGSRTTFSLDHLSGPKTTSATLDIFGKEEKKLHFSIGPTSFFQPSPTQAQEIFNLLASWMKPLKLQRCLDLYCGIGTLTMVAACSGVQEAIGVEVNEESIAIAKDLAQQNGIKNLRFYAQDVGQFLKSFDEPYDCLILDPPRAGMGEGPSKKAALIGAKHVFYLSCNPRTQVEDLKSFIDAGYRIERVRPIDQFPHTMHVENLVYLKKG